MFGTDETKPVCKTPNELRTVFGLAEKFRGMNENEVFRRTGCLASCTKV